MRRNTLRELRAYCRRVGPLIHAFTEASETVFRFLTAYDKREKGKRLSQGDRRLLETWEALFAGHKAVCHDVLPQLGHVRCPPLPPHTTGSFRTLSSLCPLARARLLTLAPSATRAKVSMISLSGVPRR